MAEYLEWLDDVEIFERMIRREARFRPRTSPMDDYDDAEFISRFRLPKPAVHVLLDRIHARLEHSHKYRTSINQLLHLLITLRFYASSSFLEIDGDIFGVHKSTVSRTVVRVSRAIASLRDEYIMLPEGEEVHRVQREFFDISGIPGVVGVIDCTHIPIRSPGGLQAELFRNRKDFPSINVQVGIQDHL